MVAGRNEQSAALLADGRVLVVGGQVRVHQTDASIEAEIFDPATSSWTATAPSLLRIGFATATPLRNGNVLVVGVNDVELYDPATDVWRSTSYADARVYNMAIALRDGTVLVAGGIDGFDRVLGSTAIYDPGELP
jgi:hypothetical protein